MGKAITTDLPDDLKSLGAQIEHWRETRQKLSPMPAALWAAAVTLAQERGIYPVARGLRIDYASLRTRLAESRGLAAPSHGAPQSSEFIELSPSPALAGSAGGPCVGLELRDADGSRMSLLLPGLDGLDVPGIVSAFRRRPA